MAKKLMWSIGKEGVTRTRLDSPPYRAFVYWTNAQSIVESRDFSRSELDQYITSHALSPEDLQQLQLALAALDDMAGGLN